MSVMWSTRLVSSLQPLSCFFAGVVLTLIATNFRVEQSFQQSKPWVTVRSSASGVQNCTEKQATVSPLALAASLPPQKLGAAPSGGIPIHASLRLSSPPPNKTDGDMYGRSVWIKQCGVRFQMYLHEKQDTVSDHITKYGVVYCDLDLIQHFEEGRKRGVKLTFVDIGSNVGSCAVLAAAMGHEAWAFEPLPLNFHLIERTIEANDRFGGRLHLTKCGASDKSGSFDIFTLPFNYGHSTVKKQAHLDKQYVKNSCCMQKFDEVVPPSIEVDLMKLDTEGHESRALQGATSLFSNASRMPVFVNFELWGPVARAQGLDPYAARNFLLQRSYKVILQQNEGALHDEHALLCGAIGRKYSVSC